MQAVTETVTHSKRLHLFQSHNHTYKIHIPKCVIASNSYCVDTVGDLCLTVSDFKRQYCQ